MTKPRPTTAIALTATAALAGCHFIKVNGKPLGGSSSSSSRSTEGASASEAAQTTPTSGAADATQAAASSQPAAGDGGSAGAAKPELCAELNIYTSSDYSPADFADLKTDEDNISSVAGSFAHMMCTRGKVSDRDKIMAIRASWMKTIGIDEQDFLVLAGKSRHLSYDSQDESKIPGPLGQVPRNADFRDLDQLGARASMYSRFALAEDCLMLTGGTTLLREVLCTRERLDPAKAYAEIDSVKAINLGTRYRLRRMVKRTNDEVERIRAELVAKAKGEPGLAKVIAIADAQFKEWDSPSPLRAKLLAQLAAMEAATKANKYSAFEGCEATTRASWEQHLATLELPKVSPESALATLVTATMGTPEGYLAYQALRLCTAGTAGTSNQGYELVRGDVYRRGPRSATIAAWIAASSEIKFDDRSMTMGSLLATAGLYVAPGWSADRPRHGVIGAIGKPEKGTVTISFKHVAEPREACLEERQTKRIVGFMSNNAPIYERTCVKWGMVKMNLTADPIRIDAGMAHGLKPGMFLVGIDLLGVHGVAIVATARAKSATPIWVFGGAVK